MFLAHTRLLIGCVLLLGVTSAAFAAEYEIPWNTIDGGGGTWSLGAGYELGGTIGQPDANTVEMTGGGFSLIGGFWAGAAPPTPCFGDLDGDNLVGLSDLQILLSAYGSQAGEPNWQPAADLDGNGIVDLADLQQLLTVYGTTC